MARKPGTITDELPILPFASPAAFEKWLAKEHARSSGIWLELAKKESGIPSVSYAEAVEVALCFGWIDGQGRPLDAKRWLQRFTPRGPRSKWSKINVGRAERLIAERRMQPAGQREIDKAKLDGRWDAAYDSPSKAAVPEDLQRALARNRKARAFFEDLDRTNRYAILYRVHEAKKPETRARRIAQFVEMLSEGRTIHPPRRKNGTKKGAE